MNSKFYKSFEDKYRGSRESIKTRLEVYSQFVLPLRDIYPDAPALDLGCGRCEWLELMTEFGFSAYGVDSDEHMIEEGKKLGLNTHCTDALAFLKNAKAESQTVISAFHLVEHIPFESLHELVIEALRVLRPGGLLIMETPNPENLVVGSCNFYIDPTHNKPIPPNLLAFLPEYYGFKKHKIVRLQEQIKLPSKTKLTLMDVLSGVSPDYAVVAQKNADPLILKSTNQAFKKDYGVNLEQLAAAFHRSTISQRVKNKLLGYHRKVKC
jgi:SAM-dependent methyltransferase